MDSRTAAHVLSRIADYSQLRGESAFKSRAYAGAAREIRALGVDDLAPFEAREFARALVGLER